MNWKPNPWIAGTLGLLLQWPAMLYVIRPLAAFAYLAAGLALGVFGMWAAPRTASVATCAAVGLVALPVICAIHAFLLARRATAPAARPWYSRWYGVLGLPLAAFVLVTTVHSIIVEPFRIPSSAMYPTVPSGSFVLVEKFGFGYYGRHSLFVFRQPPSRLPDRGDMIVFEYPRDPDQLYLKRVIGVPGDRIELRNGDLVINGQPAELRLISETVDHRIYEEFIGDLRYSIARTKRPFHASPPGTWQVPDGKYFVLGDNRDNSEDSRYWGFVPAGNLVGRVW